MTTLDFDKGGGLLPAIAQDHSSGKVLMLAYMNRQAWEKTLQTREAHYWSRSRRELWHKGSSSGNVQKVKEILVDCDQDTILLKVEQVGGAACHTGFDTCFHRMLDAGGNLRTIGRKIFDPQKVYGK